MNITSLPILPILVCALFFAGCGQKNAQPADFDRAALAAAVDRADTSTAEQAHEIALALPSGVAQDSFYALLVEKVGEQQNDPKSLREHAVFYQKLRGGKPGAEILLANIWGTADFIDDKTVSAKQWYEKGLQLAETARDTAQIIDFLRTTAYCDMNLGKIEEATKGIFRAIYLMEARAADPLEIANLQLDLSSCLMLSEDFDRSIDIANRAGETFKKAGETANESKAIFQAGAAMEQKGDDANALVFYEKTIELRKKEPIPPALVEVYGQCANYWNGLKNYPKAIKAIEEAMFWNQKSQYRGMDGRLECLLGETLFKSGDLAVGKNHLHAALELGKQQQDPSLESYANEMLYQLHKAANQPADALRFYEKMVAQRDTQFSAEKQKTISELNIKYETSEKAKQLAEAEDHRKIALQQMLISSLLLFSALGVSLSFFFRQRAHRRILEQENQILAQEKQLEAERAQLKLGKAERDAELARENSIRQLKEFTEQLLEKNLQIAHLEDQQIGENREAHIEKLYHSNILNQGDWEIFKLRFDQAYPGFLHQIETRYPELTPAELRLLLLSKMGVTVASEIGAILGVSADAVRKSRHRLRKKMGVSDMAIAELFPAGDY